MLKTKTTKNSINNFQTLVIILLLIIIGIVYYEYLSLQNTIEEENLKAYKQGANDMKQSLKEDLFYLEYMQQQLEKQK